MSKLFIKAVIICSFVLAISSLGHADDSKWSGNASLGFFSDYMFRGTRLYDGMSIQPSAKSTYSLGDAGAISGSLWAHFSGDHDTAIEKFTELDEILSYDISFDPVTISLGHAWYTYPDSDDDINSTNEFFGTVVVNTLLTPTLSIYSDYRQYDNEYYELAVSHPFEVSALGDGFGFTAFAAFGFASNAEKVYADDGLVQVTTGVSFNATLGDVAITPTLNYTFESDDNALNQFWMGATLGYTF